MTKAAAILALCAIAATVACDGRADPPRLVLGTTHTLEDSGLLEVLTRAHVEERGAEHRLSIVVAGSGEVLTMARRGDIDVVLSHSPADESALMAENRGESRQPVMHNDFVLLGPPADPAGAGSAGSPAAAVRRIAQAQQAFVSRGDDSGTHRKELALWAAAGMVPEWSGYIEAGSGMADALRLASQREAYILADRATFEVLKDELRLGIVHEGDGTLVNQYSVIVVNGARNADGARDFAAWIRGARAQRLIGGYRAADGDLVLFVPDAIHVTQ